MVLVYWVYDFFFFFGGGFTSGGGVWCNGGGVGLLGFPFLL